MHANGSEYTGIARLSSRNSSRKCRGSFGCIFGLQSGIIAGCNANHALKNSSSRGVSLQVSWASSGMGGRMMAM
jgi:hypothetical protein